MSNFRKLMIHLSPQGGLGGLGGEWLAYRRASEWSRSGDDVEFCCMWSALAMATTFMLLICTTMLNLSRGCCVLWVACRARGRQPNTKSCRKSIDRDETPALIGPTRWEIEKRAGRSDKLTMCSVLIRQGSMPTVPSSTPPSRICARGTVAQCMAPHLPTWVIQWR